MHSAQGLAPCNVGNKAKARCTSDKCGVAVMLLPCTAGSQFPFPRGSGICTPATVVNWCSCTCLHATTYLLQCMCCARGTLHKTCSISSAMPRQTRSAQSLHAVLCLGKCRQASKLTVVAKAYKARYSTQACRNACAITINRYLNIRCLSSKVHCIVQALIGTWHCKPMQQRPNADCNGGAVCSH